MRAVRGIRGEKHMNNAKKVISKYYRLKMTDRLQTVIRDLPIRGMRENQVGNHVYSGIGEMKVGAGYFPVTVHVRIVHGTPRVYISAPGAGIEVSCPFDKNGTGEAVKEAIRKSLN